MIFYIKESKLKKIYNKHVSDSLLVYILKEQCFLDKDIIIINTKKNIEKQLKDNNISFKEFALYTAFYGEHSDKSELRDDLYAWKIAETIVKANINKINKKAC